MTTGRWAERLGGVGRVLSTRAYRTYWFGQVFQVQGIWIHRIAAGWLAYHLTGSAAWLGGVGFAMTAAHIALGPIAGALSDRIGHRWTAIGAVGSGFVLLVILTLLTVFDLMTPGLLVAVVLVQSVGTAFEFPARQSLIPTLIPREHMTEAMALNWATFTVAQFSGPLIAGLLLTLGGAKLAFAAVVLCYAWMEISLFRIGGAAPPTRGAFKLGGLIGEIGDGMRYLWRHPSLPTVIGLQIAVMMLLRPHIDLMPGIAVAVFKADARGLTILLGASGAGAMTLAVLMTVRAREALLAPMLVFGSAGSAAAVLVFAFTTTLPAAAVSLAVAGGLLAGLGIAASTLIQTAVEPVYRGRVISIAIALAIGGPSFGALAFGWLAEQFGFPHAIATGAAGVLVLIGVGFRPMLRRLRSAPAIS